MQSGSSCDYGVMRYTTEYIDPLAALLRDFASVPVSLLVEPDSLANLATTHAPTCGAATRDGYRRGITYALQSLAPLASAVYLDAGHGGWLSYAEGLTAFLRLVREMQISHMLRGFATNVANYQPLGSDVCDASLFESETKPDSLRRQCGGGRGGHQPCCADPCRILSNYGWGAAASACSSARTCF